MTTQSSPLVQQHHSPGDAIHHLSATLLTNILTWIAIYNANFDPLRLLPPKSLVLAASLIPLCIINTRLIGQRKWHFASFKVAPFFNPNLSTEVLLSLIVLIISVCRHRGALGRWTDATLRALPLHFAIVQLLALTPIFSDHKTQSVGVHAGTILDTFLYVGAAGWGVVYAGLLAWRAVGWGGGCLLAVLRWVARTLGL